MLFPAKTLGALAMLALALACGRPALAQTSPARPAATPAAASPPPAQPSPPLDFARSQQVLARLQNQLPSATNDSQLAGMAHQTAAIQSSADRLLAAQESQLAQVEASLRQPLPGRRRRPNPAETRQRAELTAQAAALQAQIAQPRALAAQASRTYSLIAERRRQSFSDRVLTPTASPLSPDFWTSLAQAAGSDLGRLESLILVSATTAWAAPEPRGFVGLAIGLGAAFVLVLPLHLWLQAFVWRICHRLRLGHAGRTLAVILTATLDVGLAAAGAGVLRLGAKWGGLLAPGADQLAQACVDAVAWGAVILALGRALATNRRSERRLLELDDGEAARARAVLWIVAVITGGGLLVRRLNYILGASLAATIGANCVISLAYAGAAGLMLVSFSREPTAPAAPPTPPARRPAWTLMSLILAAAIVGTVGAVLLGYTTLAALISGQIFWLSIIAAVAYLLLRLIDDVCAAVFKGDSRPARTLSRLFGLKTTTIVQIGLLVSAGAQLLILLAAVGLALTPFGQSGELLLRSFRELGGSVQIGKAVISPVAIIAGVATFAFGMSLAHLARAWLVKRYLPVTDWDAGVRNSVSTGVAYLGVAIALACGLAVTGLGFQQIALIASALSVGIGFGLQQVVQNFVAGIILLIERPVKVGDRVNIGGVEGDVLKIRVRATEIRGTDWSTIIVPNSNLITNNVQNRTPPDPRARVRLQVNLAKPADVKKVRELILGIVGASPEVLKHPEPQVYIDGMAEGGGVSLSCWIHLDSARDATRIKSELYFEILDAFQEGAIALL
jgi:small-conductance mechanosensitive channel